MEDLQGALPTKGLRISFTADKGRCLVSTRNFFAGDVIIRQNPYASISNFSHDSRCESCFSSCSLKKCSACRMTWYCGSSCQKSEWILHQQECQALVKLSADRRKMLTPSLRLMIRIFLKKSLQSQQIIPTTAADNYDLVEALMAHMLDIGEQRLLLYAQMSNLVNLILPSLELNIKEITQNFSKLACNAHTICDSELRPLGTGLYPVISIINHSCLPNSVLVFEGREAVVRAVEPIPKDTEVTISYIETAASSETRQKALKEQYFFTCKCPQCIKRGFYEDIKENATLDGYRCKDQNCDGFLVFDRDKQAYVCSQCGLTRDHYETEKMANELKQLREKASISLSSSNYSEACVMYKTIEQLQLKLCHSFSISLLQTRETLLKILLELQDWRGALSYCRLTIPVYERVYPPIHPLSGLQYYTCGKLEWLLGDIQDAQGSLAMAANILRITHGIDTPFVKSLLIKLEEASEAAYRLANDR